MIYKSFGLIGMQLPEKYKRSFDVLSVPSLAGLKISFPGPSDKMSGDVEFGSDICPMTFSSVLTRK
jgi:hypothetical protein